MSHMPNSWLAGPTRRRQRVRDNTFYLGVNSFVSTSTTLLLHNSPNLPPYAAAREGENESRSIYPPILVSEQTLDSQLLRPNPRLFPSLPLSLTLLLPILRLPPLKPQILRSMSVVHTLVLLLLSFAMALGCILTMVSHTPHLRLLRLEGSETRRHTPHRRRELHPTAHVPLRARPRDGPDHVVLVVTNTCVHVLIYGYYLWSALGVRPKWKRVVTDCQIVQFLFSFAVSGLMLHYHFGGSGCSGFSGWCFNAVFNASLLALFVDFHAKSYANRKETQPPHKHKGS